MTLERGSASGGRGRDIGLPVAVVVASLLLPALRHVTRKCALAWLGLSGLGFRTVFLLASAEVGRHYLGGDFGAIDRVVFVARAAEGILAGPVPDLDLKGQQLLPHSLIPIIQRGKLFNYTSRGKVLLVFETTGPIANLAVLSAEIHCCTCLWESARNMYFLSDSPAKMMLKAWTDSANPSCWTWLPSRTMTPMGSVPRTRN